MHSVPEDTQGDEAVECLWPVFSLQQPAIPVKWYTLLQWYKIHDMAIVDII